MNQVDQELFSSKKVQEFKTTFSRTHLALLTAPTGGPPVFSHLFLLRCSKANASFTPWLNCQEVSSSSRSPIEDGPCQPPPPAHRWVLGNEVITGAISFRTPWTDSQRLMWSLQDSSQRVCRASDSCQEGGGASDEMADETERGKFKNTKRSLVLSCAAFRGC